MGIPGISSKSDELFTIDKIILWKQTWKWATWNKLAESHQNKINDDVEVTSKQRTKKIGNVLEIFAEVCHHVEVCSFQF